jgi:preprotein translocase subunit SecB
MSDAAGGGQRAAPRLSVRAQYIKDLSFENPNAPRSLRQSKEQPQIDVAVDVDARTLGSSNYEVGLRITANAARGGEAMFVVELYYAGVFLIQNFPADRLEAICLVECPRIIFPFARRVIAETTRDGGFSPLLLDPINFAALYRQRHGQSRAPGPADAAETPISVG